MVASSGVLAKNELGCQEFHQELPGMSEAQVGWRENYNRQLYTHPGKRLELIWSSPWKFHPERLHVSIC